MPLLRRIWTYLHQLFGGSHKGRMVAVALTPEEAEFEDVIRWIASVEHPTLSSSRRDRIWSKALSQAETRQAPAPTRRRSLFLRPAWTWASLVVALMLVFGSVGVVSASQDSLPNETLYPVKRFSERVWFSVTPEGRRSEVALEFLMRRMEEVETLAWREEPIPHEVLDNMEYHLRWVEQASRQELVSEDALERVAYHRRKLEQLLDLYPHNNELVFALNAARRTQASLTDEPYVPHEPVEEFPPGEDMPEDMPVPEPAPTPVSPGYTPPVWRVTPEPGESLESPGVVLPGPTLAPPGEEPAPAEDDDEDEDDGDEDHVPPGLQLTPPGLELTPPGLQLTPPGLQQTPPGQGETPPGQGETPPGQGETPPGQGQTPPGQGQTPPGQGQTPPGQNR